MNRIQQANLQRMIELAGGEAGAGSVRTYDYNFAARGS